MHIYFEPLERPASFSDCKIVYLSWMGRVSDAFLQSFNDEQQQEEILKFNHIKYYEEGWLATGNQRGIVGITYTSCNCPTKLNKMSMPFRTNYNLRGHRSEIKFVKFNEPFQKLATVDTNGTIFVWIKDNRWLIELIKDREMQVIDFNWSHDGRMTLITYIDGFILIGSVTGQRYWSSLLNLDTNQITSGIWSPDDKNVIIGVSDGSFIVLNLNGTILAQFMLKENVSITKMAWSCEKFKLDEDQDASNDPLSDSNMLNLNATTSRQGSISHEFRVNSPMAGRTFGTQAFDSNKDDNINNCFRSNYKQHVLAICFEDGYIYLLRNYDDPFPCKINTKLLGIQMEWSNKGEILAVGGHMFNMIKSTKTPKQPHYMNVIKFYANSNIHLNFNYTLRYVVNLNYTLSPITAITWAHNDRRIFVATHNCVHTAWVTKKMPKLQLLSRLAIKQFVRREQDVKLLRIPASLRILIRSLFVRTIRCHLPDLNNLRDFCINPPPSNMRYFCTLIRHIPKDGYDSRSKLFSTYVLYLEYLGGLIPILKGKRTSKLKPEFVIYDPQTMNKKGCSKNSKEMFENCFNKFDNRRSSTRRIAYYVPETKESAIKDQSRSRKNSSNQTKNGEESTSESDEDFQLSNLETIPLNLYKSLLKSKLINKKCDRYSANLMVNNQQEMIDLTNNQETNNLANQYVTANESNEEIETNNSPLGLTLLGHNSIIFTRRRAINSSNQTNSNNKMLNYVDEMPESKKFLLITSNIWGTRFKFLGLTSWLPSSIGCISYKTSLLHLQPRQMQLQIKEMIFTPNSSNSLKEEITENVLKSCESNSDLNNVDEDVEWNNTSFEDDEYIKTIPVAPLSPQFLNANLMHSNNTNKLNSPPEFSSMEEYLSFQIDPSSEQINCNLTYSSNQSNHPNNFNPVSEFCKRNQHYKDDGNLHFLHSLQPNTTTITNSVSTQTSFPSLNNLNNQSTGQLHNEEDDDLNTMNTLASCSRLIHSSSMICSGKNANQFKEDHLRLQAASSDDFTKRLINRKSFDLGLQRRLTLKNARRPLSTYSLKLDSKAKCILNCMYLDTEEMEEEKNFSNLDKNDEISEEFDAEDEKERMVKQLYSELNQIDSSNESLLESYCFDEANVSNDKMMKESSYLSGLGNRFIDSNVPGTPVHKRKLLVKNEMNTRKDVNNNQNNQFLNHMSINNHQIQRKKFYSNNSFDNDENESEIRVIGNDVISSENRISNSESDLAIERIELNEKKRKNELSERISIRSEQFEYDASPDQINHTAQRPDYVNMPNNSRLSFINRSLPATPSMKSKTKDRKRSLGKTLLYSPIMIRKVMKEKLNYLDCSSDDGLSDDDNEDAPYGLKNNKRQTKMKQTFCLTKRHSLNKVQPNNDDATYSLNNTLKELIMHNKAPVWNEISQVYQLDFNGRVTKESAKNFQIEFNDKQVLQFGRIDVNAYTLDFQQPFCALQALSVALANVTQRLK